MPNNKNNRLKSYYGLGSRPKFLQRSKNIRVYDPPKFDIQKPREVGARLKVLHKGQAKPKTRVQAKLKTRVQASPKTQVQADLANAQPMGAQHNTFDEVTSNGNSMENPPSETHVIGLWEETSMEEPAKPTEPEDLDAANIDSAPQKPDEPKTVSAEGTEEQYAGETPVLEEPAKPQEPEQQNAPEIDSPQEKPGEPKSVSADGTEEQYAGVTPEEQIVVPIGSARERMQRFMKLTTPSETHVITPSVIGVWEDSKTPNLTRSLAFKKEDSEDLSLKNPPESARDRMLRFLKATNEKPSKPTEIGIQGDSKTPNLTRSLAFKKEDSEDLSLKNPPESARDRMLRFLKATNEKPSKPTEIGIQGDSKTPNLTRSLAFKKEDSEDLSLKNPPESARDRMLRFLKATNEKPSKPTEIGIQGDSKTPKLTRSLAFKEKDSSPKKPPESFLKATNEKPSKPTKIGIQGENSSSPPNPKPTTLYQKPRLPTTWNPTAPPDPRDSVYMIQQPVPPVRGRLERQNAFRYQSEEKPKPKNIASKIGAGVITGIRSIAQGFSRVGAGIKNIGNILFRRARH